MWEGGEEGGRGGREGERERGGGGGGGRERDKDTERDRELFVGVYPVPWFGDVHG